MDKKKVLVIADGVATTGFARVAHSLFVPLHDAGWEVHHLAVNYRGDPHEFPYAIYPAVLGGDIYGFGRIETLVDAIKPDVIFVLNDIWVHADYMERLKKYLGRIKIVVYFPVDAHPIEYKWVKSIQYVDRVLVYTEYGKAVLEDALSTWREKENISELQFAPIEVLNHGIDAKRFYPLDKLEAKRKLYPNKNSFHESFIVLNANRNQPRKRIDITVKGFAMFAQGKPENVKLYMHMGVEDMGWNVISLAERYGIDGRLVLSSTANHIMNVPDDRLNLIYNACDVGINTSLGEGWGLTNWEHAATRACQVVPEHSSIPELFGDGRGILMKPSMSLTNERILTEGLIVYPETVRDSLERVYRDEALRNECADKAYEFITQPRFSWETLSKQLEEIFEAALAEGPKIVPTS